MPPLSHLNGKEFSRGHAAGFDVTLFKIHYREVQEQHFWACVFQKREDLL